ncbi:MAG: ExeM/NucH family extracellular endonuclease [Acidimicrobiia bacterium]|nr:ExeM/NucH family extracellular endonuclease [Acidimicrobiia bacterium]
MGNRRRFVSFVAVFMVAMGSMPLAAPADTGDPVLLNEILASHAGTDDTEYIELYGTPNASLAGLSLIVVESDDVGNGTIDQRIDFSDDAELGNNGFFLIGNPVGLGANYSVAPDVEIAANFLENSSTTFALVESASISGTAVSGAEVVLDAVGVTDGGPADSFFFGAPVFGPDGAFYPAGVRRAADGVDTNTVGDWVLADFDLGTANTPTAGTFPIVVEITEIHYDNTGTDSGEAVEVSGPEGFDVTGWSIVLYNGSNGAVYDTTVLNGVIPAGGAFSVTFSAIQNGSPDGIALVDAGGSVVEFLSYEGVMTGVGGPADGVTSTDIGVSEPSDTPVGFSLQKIGGVWTGPAANTFAPTLEPPGPDCTVGTVLISFVQGDGAATPCDGQEVTIEGVVVGDYEGPSPTLRGFYVQEEDGDVDADPLTSEAIFVFHGSEDTVSVGDQVRVTGTVAEFQDQTQLGFPSSLEVIGSGTVTPTAVEMPFESEDYLERYEGMLVTFEQSLYVTEYFQLGRFGEVVVSSGDRLRQPTDIVEPGVAAIAMQAANNLNRLKVDDTLNNQNPDPIIFGGGGNPLTADNPLRGGDTLTGAVGVLTYTWAGNAASGNAYRLRPVNGDATFTFEAANPRPSGPADVGGTATVAGFNVLNYFLTIDSGGALCGIPGEEDRSCRGADDAEELDRQRVKLLAALDKVDTDVIGLVELENSVGVEPLADIVAGLNATAGAGTWDYIDTGTIGTDVIKVGIIYKTEAVSPLGAHAVIDSAVDPGFDDTLNRPSLAQSFTSDDGEVFTVVVNHLKSKGCTDAAGADMDQGDGQGCYNAARTSAAQALADWIATDPTGSGDTDVFILGDLNSYAKEDPIEVLVGAGFTDLGRAFGGDDTYSYVFDGQWGYLDYALGSASIFDRVEGTVEYHINADEVPVLDYNTNFKSDAQIVSLFAPDEFRTSDHDPVIVGFCDAVAPTASATADPSMLWPPNKRMIDVEVTLDVFDASGATTTLVSVTSNEADWNPRKKGPDIVIVDDTHFKLRAHRDDEGTGRIYTITYLAVDACGNETEFSTEVTIPIQLGD